jgi:hypothetical protein
MVLQNVKKYGARWDINKHQGVVSILFDTTNEWEHIVVKDAMEFFVIVDMLRNEKPIVFDDQKMHVMTSAEKIGEEES